MGTNNDPTQGEKTPKDTVIYCLAELIQHAAEGKLSSNELSLLKHLTWIIQQKRYDLGTAVVSEKELQDLFNWRHLIDLPMTYAIWRQYGKIENRYPGTKDFSFSKTQVLETFILGDIATNCQDMRWSVIGDLGFSVIQTASLIGSLDQLHSDSKLQGIECDLRWGTVPWASPMNQASVNLLSLSPLAPEESGFWMHNKPMERWGAQFCHAPSRLVLNALCTWRWKHGSFPVENFCHVGPEHVNTGPDGGHLMIKVQDGKALITSRRNYDRSEPFSFCVMRRAPEA